MASHQEASYNAGETKGRTEEKTGQMMDKGRQAADVTKEKASETVQPAKEPAQAGKDKTGGILQQAGEQVKTVTIGARDAVKNTLGMGDNKGNEKGATGCDKKNEY